MEVGHVSLLQLKTKFPGSPSHCLNNLGGCIAFLTHWSQDVDIQNIRLDALFTIKISDGSSISIKFARRDKKEHGLIQQLSIGKDVKLDDELFYHEERSFLIEAELKLTQGETNDEEASRELKASDVVVVAGNGKF